MRILKRHDFGEVTGYELGWAPFGKPWMTVYIYMLDTLLLDTGQSHSRHEVLELVTSRRIETALLTHHHEDHSGNAGVLSRTLGIQVFGHPLTVAKMKRPFKIFPYQHYAWGRAEPLSMNPLPEIVEAGSFKLLPVHTPGHSKDHTVYLEPERGWLFAGDLYLADRIKYFRADENIKEQIASLRKVLALEFESLFCCHRPRPRNGKEHIGRKLRFLEEIFGKVADLAKEGFDETQVMQRLGLKESSLIKAICFGNVSMRNMVRSVMDSL